MHAKSILHLQLAPALVKLKYFDIFERMPSFSVGLICHKTKQEFVETQ